MALDHADSVVDFVKAVKASREATFRELTRDAVLPETFASAVVHRHVRYPRPRDIAAFASANDLTSAERDLLDLLADREHLQSLDPRTLVSPELQLRHMEEAIVIARERVRLQALADIVRRPRQVEWLPHGAVDAMQRELLIGVEHGVRRAVSTHLGWPPDERCQTLFRGLNEAVGPAGFSVVIESLRGSISLATSRVAAGPEGRRFVILGEAWPLTAPRRVPPPRRSTTWSRHPRIWEYRSARAFLHDWKATRHISRVFAGSSVSHQTVSRWSRERAPTTERRRRDEQGALRTALEIARVIGDHDRHFDADAALYFRAMVQAEFETERHAARIRSLLASCWERGMTGVVGHSAEFPQTARSLAHDWRAAALADLACVIPLALTPSSIAVAASMLRPALSLPEAEVLLRQLLGAGLLVASDDGRLTPQPLSQRIANVRPDGSPDLDLHRYHVSRSALGQDHLHQALRGGRMPAGQYVCCAVLDLLPEQVSALRADLNRRHDDLARQLAARPETRGWVTQASLYLAPAADDA